MLCTYIHCLKTVIHRNTVMQKHDAQSEYADAVPKFQLLAAVYSNRVDKNTILTVVFHSPEALPAHQDCMTLSLYQFGTCADNIVFLTPPNRNSLHGTDIIFGKRCKNSRCFYKLDSNHIPVLEGNG